MGRTTIRPGQGGAEEPAPSSGLAVVAAGGGEDITGTAGVDVDDGGGLASAGVAVTGVGGLSAPPVRMGVGEGGKVGMGQGVGVTMLSADAPTDSAQSC
jgi:hypothetical protein